ncbi:MAG: hypothetical protein LBG24_03075, partial [Treponema sp.]|nr:hypothetical protein [Treponema sp.]
QLDKIVAKINNRPRKVLGYLTPYEVFSPYNSHFKKNSAYIKDAKWSVNMDDTDLIWDEKEGWQLPNE